MNPASSSPTMQPQGEDIKERYEKLSQDYQRIKSQNSILKKAVIQEQQKVGTLEKELREAEQKLRQVTEETDILQFNNERLTKRLSVLQDELATKSKEGGWRWGGSSRDLTKKSEELDIIRSELEEKIRENAQLHIEKRDLEEDIKQAIQLHGDQALVLKQMVVAKQEEVDQALARAKALVQDLDNLQLDLQKQVQQTQEAEERLGREVQQVAAGIDQARKRFKVSIVSPSQTPPSPLAVWRDNKHTRELIGTFKELYFGLSAHWDTHMDKIAILQDSNPPEQLANIYRELRSTIPSLSTQMTHISESLHQYLPVLFSKEALPNLEFADTLHRFVNTCKKWLSYQKTRHMELSQQGGTPVQHQHHHSTLAEQHSLVLRALDRLVEVRELDSLRSLCSSLSLLSSLSLSLFDQEALGVGEGALAKSGGRLEELVAVNAKLLDSQGKTIALLDKFSAKLEEYESLAGSVLQDSEDSHRLREISSHLIMLYNDINVATREREMQHLSVQKDSDALKQRIKELQDVIARKEDEHAEQEKRLAMSKDHARVLSQEIETLRGEKYDFERSMSEKQAQLRQELEQAMATQKLQLEAINTQALSASVSRYEAELSSLRGQLSDAQRQLAEVQQTVVQLRQDLQTQQQRASNAEQQVVAEQQRFAAQRQDIESHEGKTQELQRSHSSQLFQLQNEVATKQKQIQDLQGKITAIEGNARSEMAEKAQQVKILQQKLMTQETKLDEKNRQIQATERLVAEKEQQLIKLQSQKSPEIISSVGSTLNESQPLVSLMDSDIPPISGETLLEQRDTLELTPQLTPQTTPRTVIEDTIAPLTPTLSNKGPKYSMTVIDEAGNQSNGLNLSSLDKEREQALKEHYEAKLQQVSTQMKTADAKAVQLSEQYNSLVKTLESKEAERGGLLDQVKAANQVAKDFKEDLESTRSNYDTQLRMLSELALTREDKIQSLEAENGAVKGCKVACGKCKTWNSIEWLLTDGRGGQRCAKGNHPLTTFML